MPDTHLPVLRYDPTDAEQRKRIEFQTEYPAWHFAYSEGGTYTATKSLGGENHEAIHLVGTDLGEAVDKARAYEEAG